MEQKVLLPVQTGLCCLLMPKHTELSGETCRSRGLEKSYSNGTQARAGAMQVRTAPSLFCQSRVAQAPSGVKQFHGHCQGRDCCCSQLGSVAAGLAGPKSAHSQGPRINGGSRHLWICPPPPALLSLSPPPCFSVSLLLVVP